MTDWQRLETEVRSLVARKKFMSIEWKFYQKNKLKTEGIVNAEKSRIKFKTKDNPIYRIYSMTKPLISVAALIGIERHKLHLADPLIKYLPIFENVAVHLSTGKKHRVKRQITILDLLTHNAGFSYGFNNDCHIGKMYKKDKLIHNSSLKLKEFVEKIAQYPLAFQPGTQWKYSIATDVLARVLEIIFNDSIENILTTLIFKPLDMSDTSYFLSKEKYSRLMPIYGEPNLDLVFRETSPQVQQTEVDLKSFYSPNKNTYNARGGHGLFSTAEDYGKFCKALLADTYGKNPNLISKTILNEALSNRIPRQQIPIKINGEARLGYGWNLLGRVNQAKKENGSKPAIKEFGWSGAATTYFWVEPNSKIIGIIMTQQLGQHYPLGEKLRAICTQTLNKKT